MESDMPLLLAAAGRGSRLGELTSVLPKSLLPEPVFGKAILHHIYERLEKETNIQQIIIVGENDSNAAEQILKFTQEFPFCCPPEIEIVKGERRGVGYAFFLGAERLKEIGLADAIMSVADSIAATYSNLIHNQSAVVVGVTRPDPRSEKAFTSIQVNAAGIITKDPQVVEKDASKIARGIYNFNNGLLSEYCQIFKHGMTYRTNDSNVINAKAEFKVTWIWRQMQECGIEIAAGDLVDLVELNVPKDFDRFRDFFSQNNKHDLMR